MKELQTLDEYQSTSNGFIYFGSPDCPSCVDFMPVLEKITNERSQEVYYFKIDHFLKNNLLTETEFEKITQKFNITKIPTVIEILNDKQVASITTEMFRGSGEQHVKEQLNVFFDGSTQKNVPFSNVHNVIVLVVFNSLVILTCIMIWRKGSSMTYSFIAVAFLVLNSINMWNYGIYVDEHNSAVTEHIRYIIWINFILALVPLITNKIYKGEQKNEKTIY